MKRKGFCYDSFILFTVIWLSVTSKLPLWSRKMWRCQCTALAVSEISPACCGSVTLIASKFHFKQQARLSMN